MGGRVRKSLEEKTAWICKLEKHAGRWKDLSKRPWQEGCKGKLAHVWCGESRVSSWFRNKAGRRTAIDITPHPLPAGGIGGRI
jgi:hypothetical protein